LIKSAINNSQSSVGCVQVHHTRDFRRCTMMPNREKRRERYYVIHCRADWGDWRQPWDVFLPLPVDPQTPQMSLGYLRKPNIGSNGLPPTPSPKSQLNWFPCKPCLISGCVPGITQASTRSSVFCSRSRQNFGLIAPWIFQDWHSIFER
jgi:hypothetical protein